METSHLTYAIALDMHYSFEAEDQLNVLESNAPWEIACEASNYEDNYIQHYLNCLLAPILLYK